MNNQKTKKARKENTRDPKPEKVEKGVFVSPCVQLVLFGFRDRDGTKNIRKHSFTSVLLCFIVFLCFSCFSLIIHRLFQRVFVIVLIFLCVSYVFLLVLMFFYQLFLDCSQFSLVCSQLFPMFSPVAQFFLCFPGVFRTKRRKDMVLLLFCSAFLVSPRRFMFFCFSWYVCRFSCFFVCF